MTKPPNKNYVGDEVFFRDVSRGTGATSPLRKGIKKGKQRKREITPPHKTNNGGASVFLGTCVDAEQHQTRTKKETKENENMNARNVPFKKNNVSASVFLWVLALRFSDFQPIEKARRQQWKTKENTVETSRKQKNKEKAHKEQT